MPTTPRQSARLIRKQCLAGRARQISRLITRIYDEELRPLKLKLSQLSILVAVADAGHAGPAELCHELGLEQSTLSRNVANLKRQGWVVARRGADRRFQELELTRMGEAVLLRALPRWRNAQREATRLLGPDAASALLQLCDEAHEHASGAPEVTP